MTTQILFADDSELGRKLFTVSLKKRGYTVDTAENGYAVLEKLRQTAYRIVMMDINMPKLDGIQTVKQIRDSYDADHLPIMIAVSGNTTDADHAYYLANGFHYFIPKPIDMPTLFDLLESILN